jgi:hypothetical protein
MQILFTRQRAVTTSFAVFLAGSVGALLASRDVGAAASFFAGLGALAAVAAGGRWVLQHYAGDPEERAFVERNYWRALVLLLMLTALCYALLLAAGWKGRPGFLYDDEPLYDRVGQMIAERWRSAFWFDITMQFDSSVGSTVQPGVAYPWMVGAIYYLFGPYALLVRFVNALAGLWAAFATANMARIIFSRQRRIAEHTFWGVVLLPFILTWTVSETRDIQVCAASAIVLWILMRSLRRISVGLILIAALTLIWLYYLRPLSVYLVLVASVPGLLLHMWSGDDQPHHQAGKIRRIILGGIVVCTILLLPLALQELRFKASQYGITAAGSGLGSAFGISTETDLRSLLHPSPFWMFKEASFYLEYHFLPGLAWYVLLPLWLWGLLMSPRRELPDLWILRIFVVEMLLLSIFSTATGYNDPMRTRVPALPYLVLFSAWTIVPVSQKISRRIYAMCGCCYAFLLLTGVYDLLNNAFSLPAIGAILGFVPAFVYFVTRMSKKLSQLRSA